MSSSVQHFPGLPGSVKSRLSERDITDLHEGMKGQNGFWTRPHRWSRNPFLI